MNSTNSHWTNNSIDDFLYRIAADFTGQLEQVMEETGTSQTKLAKLLGVSEGRVSQIMNNPGNLTLRKIIEYTRALGRKASIVAYDDNDPENRNGPVNSEIFALCWNAAGKPVDFFSLASASPKTANAIAVSAVGVSDPMAGYRERSGASKELSQPSRGIGNIGEGDLYLLCTHQRRAVLPGVGAVAKIPGLSQCQTGLSACLASALNSSAPRKNGWPIIGALSKCASASHKK